MSERPAEDQPADPELIEALAKLLHGLRPGSIFHLETALLAAEREGVSGRLEIEIPRKNRDYPEVRWHGQ